MGTINWTLTGYGDRQFGTIASSDHADSGSFTSSSSALDVTSLNPLEGQVLRVNASAEAWIAFGGVTAAVGTGHYLPAGMTQDFGISKADARKAVSVIDV